MNSNLILASISLSYNGIRAHSCTNGIMVSISKGNVDINLPPKAQVANKIDVSQPILLRFCLIPLLERSTNTKSTKGTSQSCKLQISR